MKIKLLNKNQLKDFLNSSEFRQMPVVPISPHRGRSHIENPRVRPRDILLILVYDEQNQMIGYLGLLPDDLFYDGKTIHCAWMSCIWVSENARGQGIAKKMVQTAYEIWDGNILATEFTSDAYRMYQKMGIFDDFLTKEGIRIYTRFITAEVLPRKRKWLRIFSIPLRGFDAVANVFAGQKWKRLYKAANFTNLIFIENNFNGEIFPAGKNGFFRNVKEIKWMITYPWLQEYKEETDKKYHFSSSAKQVKYFLVEEKNTRNRMLLFIRDSHLKIPFIWGNWSEATVKTVFAYAVKKYAVSVITVYYSEITKYLKDFPHLFQKPQQRRYLIGKKMNASFPTDFSCFIQDGDGDCGFT